MRRVSGLCVVAVFACGLLVAACAPAVVPPGSSTTTTTSIAPTTSTTEAPSTTTTELPTTTTTTEAPTTTVPPAARATQVDADMAHTCTRMSDGTARCWGSNLSGRFGNDSLSNSNVPVAVVDPNNTSNPLTGIANISAGGYQTCAVMADSTARCWGLNEAGRLGNDSLSNSDVPVTVVDPTNTSNPLTGFATISVGNSNVCAVMTDSTARCWGYNGSGRFGNNTLTDSKVPVAVVDPTNTANPLTGIASISAGGYPGGHTCARMLDRTARCWGTNGQGRLGNNTLIASKVPVTVVDPGSTSNVLAGVISITAGGYHTCAVMTDGSARCWGYNGTGRLGDNALANSSVPVRVSNIP
jgi:alpha-tubulin suppressor-like RCC1 family protein